MRGPTLRDLLARRAAAEPERPWLFHPDGPDWRWHGYGATAALAAGRGDPPVEVVGEVVEALALEDARLPPLARHLLPLAAPRPGGEVTVLTRAPATPAGRLLVAWSLLAGAALVLEPAAGARVPTAVWARPTLLLGDGAEVAALAAAGRRYEAARPGGRWRRLRAALGRPAPPPRPFGRLHTLLLAPPPAAAAYRGRAAPRPGGPLPDAAFWQRRRVPCIDLRAVLF